MMLEQASSAMRNAVSALSLSEQEVANLRAVVKELKEGQDGASGNEAINRERAQLRAAQQRVQDNGRDRVRLAGARGAGNDCQG